MPKGEARQAGREDIESLSVVHEPERPANTSQIMEEICERANLKQALRQVRGNKGSAGVDRMTVDQLGDYLKQHWPAIREQLLNGTYEPKPVRRVEIPKPDGGVRKLGIPTVLDRFVQQAAMQALQRRWNPTFSQYSYGFRPRRSAHHAVAQAQQYIAQGYGWVIDLDLEKFFDRVNHDKLMGQITKRVEDKRLLKLVRAFLNAGVMENGLVSPSVEGTPQGGPLSPLLSNLVLDELDRELECRGHRFVRYADDCNIYVRSERAGQRVMESISRFITQKLKLKVNEAKSAVARPQERKFLGFSFTTGPDIKRMIAPKSLGRFKQRIREITRRARGVSIKTTMEELATYMRGWRGYFGFCQTPEVLVALTRWVRLRLRAALWRQWKTPRRRRAALIALGVRGELRNMAGSGHGPWHLARSKALSVGLLPGGVWRLCPWPSVRWPTLNRMRSPRN
ncbi:MAG TPA: group II intron reverse transcriptase/maturase, partial [Candidatus Angelobacter sp.]|nr:group II intron reverse transcriptase/maturase [Candidatus Angelobacter sp.]